MRTKEEYDALVAGIQSPEEFITFIEDLYREGFVKIAYDGLDAAHRQIVGRYERHVRETGGFLPVLEQAGKVALYRDGIRERYKDISLEYLDRVVKSDLEDAVEAVKEAEAVVQSFKKGETTR